MFDNKQKKVISLIVFLFSLTMFLWFIRSAKLNLTVSSSIFWMPTFFMTISVMYQITNFSNGNKFVKYILIEILTITFLFRILAVVPLREFLPGMDDGYYTYLATSWIKEFGYPVTSEDISPGYGLDLAKWAIIHILSITAGYILNVNLYTLVSWLPSIYSSFGLVFVYIIAKQLYNDERVALFSTLAFATFSTCIDLYPRYIREGLAVVFLTAAIAMHLRAIKTNNEIRFKVVTIIFILTTMLTHPFTGMMSVLFFTFLLLTFHFEKKVLKNSSGCDISPSLSFLLITIVTFFSIQFYIEGGLFNMGLSLVDNFFSAGKEYSYIITVPTPYEPDIRNTVIKYGNWAYILLFATIMLYEVIKKRDCKNLCIVFFTACWSGFMFIWYGIIVKTGDIDVIGIAARLFVFVYPFVLMAVSHTILEHRRHCTKLLSAILIGFIFINIIVMPFISFNNWDTIRFSDKKDGIIINPYDGSQERCAITWFNKYTQKQSVYTFDDKDNNIIKLLAIQSNIWGNPEMRDWMKNYWVIIKINSGYQINSTQTLFKSVYDNGEITIYTKVR